MYLGGGRCPVTSGRVRSCSRRPLDFLVDVYARAMGVVTGILPTFEGSGTSLTVQGGVIHPLTSLAMIGGDIKV